MFDLPKLKYPYDSLEPYIGAQTMEIHHSKHHQAYVNNLNKALETDSEGLAARPIEDILSNPDSIPENIKTAVVNNGGGHYNHSFFWEIMRPESKEPSGDIAVAIESSFGDFESFKSLFSETALKRFGSGWAWLVKNADGKLEVYSTSNQNCPLSEGKKPILCLDVWEHAYYLKYQNRRAEYISAWWNVVNWEKVEDNFSNL